MRARDERYPVRCSKCGNVIAVREANRISSSLRHRNRKKEVRVTLHPGQTLYIDCEKCGQNNMVTGNMIMDK